MGALILAAFAEYKIVSTSYSLSIADGSHVLVNNSAILVGNLNTTTAPISLPSNGTNGTKLFYRMITPTVAKVEVSSRANFIGARFSDVESSNTTSKAYYYGVWEYPWHGGLANRDIAFDLKGIGNNNGINWASARAPFFLSSSGYGIYTDTLKMGSYDFSTPGEVQFIFNSSSLVYYVILPQKWNDEEDGGLKSVIEQYTAISARAEIPPTSGLGPTFWSDDAEKDFAPGVTNAEENFYDVVNHLYDNQIHASSMFADRP